MDWIERAAQVLTGAHSSSNSWYKILSIEDYPEAIAVIRRHAPDMTRLEAERDRLKKVVEFYAAPDNWKDYTVDGYGLCHAPCEYDKGTKAREALKDATATAGK